MTCILFSRVQGDDDVTLKVLYCGICHTDLHMIKNDWGNAMYPVVPGYMMTLLCLIGFGLVDLHDQNSNYFSFHRLSVWYYLVMIVSLCESV